MNQNDLPFRVVPSAGRVTAVLGGTVIVCGERYIAVVWPDTLAERICQLLNAEGLLDIPNSIDQQGEG